MAITYRLRALLDVGSGNFPHLRLRSYEIYNGLSTSPAIFTDPDPPLPVLLISIQDFDKAQQQVGHSKGAAGVRNAKATLLISNLESEKLYVQKVADQSLGAEQALVIIEAGGMRVGKHPSQDKPWLQVRQAAPGMPVQVIANVALLTADVKGSVFFNWQYSVDGGVNWLTAPSTPHGRTEMTGLSPLVVHAFRVSVTSRLGTLPWSQVVTFLVH
jgi:hypothetical protein